MKIITKNARDTRTRSNDLGGLADGIISDSHYQALVNNLPVGVYRNTPGPKGSFLAVNPAMMKIFGAKNKAELLQHNVSDLYENSKDRKAFADEILKHGSVKNRRLDLRTLTGKRIVGSVTATMSKGPGGEVYFDGVIEDITKQLENETALRHKETQEQLGRTLDHMIEGCQIVSPDFRYLYVNPAAARQGQKTKEQLLDRTMIEAYPGIEDTEMFRYLKRCIRTRKLLRMENEFTFPNGSKGWFELRMEPVPEGVLIFSEDITKRKNAEDTLSIRNKRLEALTKRQERTRMKLLDAMNDLQAAKNETNLERIADQAILESIGEGLIAVDAKGKIMMVNKAAEKLLGQKSSELKGARLTKLPLLDSEGRRIPAAKRPILTVLNSAAVIGPSSGDNYFVHKTKGKFPVGLTTTPIRLKGKIIGAIEVFRDISKEQEIDKAKTEFVSIASHQLRTPLGLTKWYLEAMREEGTDVLSKTNQSYLNEIHKSNERVLQVVRELLSVSRIDQRRVKNEPQNTDAVQLVRGIVDEIAPAATNKNIDLDLKIARARIPAIHIDQMRLHEVVQNLVINALEYTLPGGTVTVHVDRQGRSIVLRIVDTGMGISEEDQKRLFTKFFRSERAALQNPDGSGLGLYVVKSYVEEWGGSISVQSHEGKGSAFTITLPTKKGRTT